MSLAAFVGGATAALIALIGVGLRLRKRTRRKKHRQTPSTPFATVAVDASGLEEYDQLLALVSNIYRNTTDEKTRLMIEQDFKRVNSENSTIGLPPLLTGKQCCMLLALVDDEVSQQPIGEDAKKEWAIITEQLEGTARRVAEPCDH